MPSEEGQRSKLSLHSAGVEKSNEKIMISIKKLKNLVKKKISKHIMFNNYSNINVL